MPAGLLVTVPLPVPDLVTVRVEVVGEVPPRGIEVRGIEVYDVDTSGASSEHIGGILLSHFDGSRK